MDGKNVMVTERNITAVCLGKGGLYLKYPTYYDETVKFSDIKEDDKEGRVGSRPVNGVFVEEADIVMDGQFSSHNTTDGFIYVANGACLTILNARTLEKVAEYSAFKPNEDLASANFVHVVKTNTKTNAGAPDRIITVAYGQAGVKVFKFVPPTK